MVCDANPLMNVIVTAAGDLSPCVYLGLPVAGTFSRQFFQESYPVHNYSYGNVEAQDFSGIRQQPAYQEFTTVFRSRVAANSSLIDNLVPPPGKPSRQGNGARVGLSQNRSLSGRRPAKVVTKVLGFKP